MSLHGSIFKVLDQYPAILSGERQSLGNRGGFSGSQLWRIDGPIGPFCLRAWPVSFSSLEYLRQIHDWMHQGRSAGLEYVPQVIATRQGQTWVHHENRWWDLTSWMPGKADFLVNPSPQRMESAARALARLHLAWRPANPLKGPCPAVIRRLETYQRWKELVATGWQPQIPPADPVRPWADRAWTLLQNRVDLVPDLLAPWTARPVSLQPCLCDVWHDHVLFTGDRVTGLVDYGSVKLDHVSVDLARLLGSLAGNDMDRWTCGLLAYQEIGDLSPDEKKLSQVLDETGTILGMANWMRWLFKEKRQYEDRKAVAQRLGSLVARTL